MTQVRTCRKRGRAGQAGRLGGRLRGKRQEGVGGEGQGLEPQTSRPPDWIHPDFRPSKGPLSKQLSLAPLARPQGSGSLPSSRPGRLVRFCLLGSGPVQLCPLPRPEKLCQASMRPSHVTSCFRRFWISFPGFQAYSVTHPASLLQSASQPASPLSPSAAGRQRGHGPPRTASESKGSGLSAPGEQIPTGTPSWRPRQFKPLFPVATDYLIEY